MSGEVYGLVYIYIYILEKLFNNYRWYFPIHYIRAVYTPWRCFRSGYLSKGKPVATAK
jgi:hypothetical protein